jgi:hypothetical protein
MPASCFALRFVVAHQSAIEVEETLDVPDFL